MSDQPLGPHSKERIAGISEALLRRAEVIDVLPTPMAAVHEAAGIQERLDISKLPADLEAKKPPKWKRILGALAFRERVVFVDRSDHPSRVVFTEAHEAIHAACPWHEPVLRLDNEETLDGSIRETVEAEANFGAANLIFQGNRFFRRSLMDQVAIATPLARSDEYGASAHATLHYYAQGHPDAVALMVTGRYRSGVDGTVPIWKTVESAPFELRFGKLDSRFPGSRLSLRGGPIGEICVEAAKSAGTTSAKVAIHDRAGVSHKFVAEAYFNQHCYFVLVTERRARTLGRRARLEIADRLPQT